MGRGDKATKWFKMLGTWIWTCQWYRFNNEGIKLATEGNDLRGESGNLRLLCRQHLLQVAWQRNKYFWKLWKKTHININSTCCLEQIHLHYEYMQTCVILMLCWLTVATNHCKMELVGIIWKCMTILCPQSCLGFFPLSKLRDEGCHTSGQIIHYHKELPCVCIHIHL